MTDEEPPHPRPAMTEQEREQHLRDWFAWYMKNEPEPDPEGFLRPVVTISLAPYL